MKILIICQYYYPEPFRINDICEELANRGHDVTVVTGTPNYPMGEIYEGYKGSDKQDEVINGVQVHRCKIHPRKASVLHRLWNYFSYPVQSCKYVKTLDGSFDVVFIYQLSPVLMAEAGIQYARKWKKKCVLYCLDLWPASLAAGGVSDGLIYKWFYSKSKKIYRSVDKIITTSKSFKTYFKEQFGIDNIDYLPQYAEDMFSPGQCRKEPDEYTDLMFAGNIGTAQSVNTIIQAATLCKDDEKIRWHIVGDGKELASCKKLASELSAPVTFSGRKPIQEMPKYYATADAMIITMEKDPIISLTLPGKVQSYMAAGKPLIGAINGETQRVITEAKCGYVVDAEKADGLETAAKAFVSMGEKEREQCAYNAREYYKEFFSKGMFFNQLEQYLVI